MRERNRRSNRNQRSQPSRSTGAQRSGEKAGGAQRRRDRKSSGGNLFGFLGLSRNNSARSSSRSARSAAPSNNNAAFSRGSRATAPRSTPQRSTPPRLVGLPRASQSPSPSQRGQGSVVPFDRQNRRPSRRRDRAVTTPDVKLVQLPTPRSRSGKFMLYGARLMVFGIGIGVLAGTMLSVWDPASRLTANSSQSPAPIVATNKPAEPLPLGAKLVELEAKVNTLVTQQKGSRAGIMLMDLDTNAYVDINATEVFPAASTIKFPVLVAFFQDVDQGKIKLTETLAMKQSHIATEAGDMQYQPIGTTFSALETATQMMVASDNTATNMLIDRLGGMTALNQRFKSWGLSATLLNAVLPDIKATNTTSPKDMASLISQVQNGKLMSMKSRDRLLDIMRRIENDTLLPQGLDKGATIAHKTGTLGLFVGDIGLIDTPNGKRYLASVLVKRQRDDIGAERLIQQISKLAYQQFTQSDTSQRLDRPKIAQPPN
jgi:beta-lactamase class A